MSVDKFKFVSPGIFIDEIDESGIPSLPERMGPLIIGRFQKGPAHRPVKVNSFREFVSIFGNPAPGTATGDIWRTGDQTAPTYAAYAAQAWLRNNSPCTVYRVLGQQLEDAAEGADAKAGWTTANSPAAGATHGGAYGLFIFPNPDNYEDSGATGTAASVTMNVTTTAEIGTGTTYTVTLPDGSTTIAITGHSTIATSDFGGVSVSAAGVFRCTVDGAGAVDLSNVLKAAEIAAAFNSHGSLSAVSSDVGGNGRVVITTVAKGSATNSAVLNVNDAGAQGTDLADGNHSFTGGSGPAVTGSLAAVWYVQAGSVVLSGTTRAGAEAEGAGVMIRSNTSSPQFVAKIRDSAVSPATKHEATFNFDRDSKLFIRKVFNTDPTVTNGDLIYTNAAAGFGDAEKNYWLGETFESNVGNKGAENSQLKVSGSTPANNHVLGVILQLDSAVGTSIGWEDHQQVAKAAATGWFISQDTRGATTASFNPTSHAEKLFKIHALGGSGGSEDPGCGEATNRDIKISIENIKVPSDNFNKWGTFSLVVRRSSDFDHRPQVIERYSNLNLNPSSANYIRRVIGDRSYSYDASTKLITDLGEYENKSKHIRVECSPFLDGGGAEGYVPFGVYGPSVPRTWTLISGSAGTGADAANPLSNWATGNGLLPDSALVDNHATNHLVFAADVLTASIEFPTTRLRVSSSEGGLALASKAYFGYQSAILDKKRFDQTNLDLLRSKPADHDPHAVVDDKSQWSWVFTLDDVQQNAADTDHNVWVSGSRATGNSWTVKSGSITGALDQDIDQFTSPMFGGRDGWDITEKDPLRNTFTSPGGSSGTNRTNYAFYSLKKAIDITADPEFVEYDVACMPGVTNGPLNTALVEACESRADSLAIIDLKGNYEPPHEHDALPTDPNYAGSVGDVVLDLGSLNINSSYGCTFYPFVRIRDTINDAVLYVPPSVVALGTFSSSQRKSAVWFAPAGFTRGGLSEGSAGLPVIGVKERVTSAMRDKLYDANINPIATFPAEGIVIFGQKTLQVTQSALDRINVRRLLIYLKKEISRIAAKILFDQNVQATWDRFTGKVVPFLEGVKAGLGLTDFKVVLDETTTTPDLIDRNILYAKIFLKPARAIEFIALDFIVTRSGASFDD